jgi:hypothetical protein
MEYFGHKYVDYVPVLPSDIITALSNPAFERVVPSRGLSVSQISFALKQFGFFSQDTVMVCGIRNSGDRGVERQRYGACRIVRRP